jgi:ABC-type multidrug transport system fused ATPase/permease subunit
MGFRLVELAADLAQPWPLAIVVDSVVGQRPLGGLGKAVFGGVASRPHQLLAALAIASFLLIVISSLCDYAGDRVMNSAGERITAARRFDVFRRSQRAPLAWHDSRSVGELVSRVVVDTDRIEDALVDVFSTLVPSVVTVIGFGVVLLVLEWRLALIALAVTPLVYYAALMTSRSNRVATSQRRAAEGDLASSVTEVLQGIRTVHIHAAFEGHESAFEARNRTTLQAGLRSVDLRARLTPLLEVAAGVGATALLWLGGYGVLRGWWTVGLLLVELAYVRNMVKPLRALARLSMTLARAAASADRIHATLDIDMPDRQLSFPARTASTGVVEFRDVVLDYGRGPVLRHLDLRIEPGQCVAFVGANGAGKSSMLSLISGLYPPTSGEVLVDGVRTWEADPHSLARHVAVVPQDTFLFGGSIRDNIRYSRPEASFEELEQAAAVASVDRIAAQPPDGFDTVVGERGVGLSGGQRQRVGISRAMLVDAPVVLLDEPTSGLDADAEADVVAALSRLVKGRTVIMTTHRPALLRLADVVYEVRDGGCHRTNTLPPPEPGQPMVPDWRRPALSVEDLLRVFDGVLSIYR